MSFSKINIEDSSLQKWGIALAVGGTVIAGAGIYYYLLRDSSPPKKSKPKQKSKGLTSDESKRNVENSTNKGVVIEDVPDTPKTPLEKAQSSKNKGNKYFKAGRYDNAIECYNEAINICPTENKTDLSFFYQNRAAAFEQLKNYENVMRDCTAALDLNKRYVKALQRRAKACEILKDLEQALEDLTAVCIIEQFQDQGTLVNVDRVLKDLGRQHAKEAMETREPLLPSKQYIRNYFDSFVEDPISLALNEENGDMLIDSENMTAKDAVKNGYLQAKQHLRDGTYGEIIPCCCNELQNPLSLFKSDSLLLKATMHVLMGENKKALQDLSDIIDMNDVTIKVRVNALVKRGTLYMQHERIEECLADFNIASAADSSNPDVFHHRGQINLLLGNVDAAMLDFKTSVDLNSEFSIAVVQKCYTDYRYAHQMGDTSAVTVCMDKFEEAIKKFPKCMECYVLYAQVLCDQNEFAKADEFYLKAIEVDPECPSTLVHRALLMLQWKGDLATARKYIENALELDNTCELAYENLATVEVQTGNLKRGVELFDKAIPLSKTEMEMAHLFSLRDAAVAQLKIVDKMGIQIPQLSELPPMSQF